MQKLKTFYKDEATLHVTKGKACHTPHQQLSRLIEYYVQPNPVWQHIINLETKINPLWKLHGDRNNFTLIERNNNWSTTTLLFLLQSLLKRRALPPYHDTGMIYELIKLQHHNCESINNATICIRKWLWITR